MSDKSGQDQINPAGNFVYVVGLSAVNKCPVQSSGSLGSCVSTGATNLPPSARSVAISSDNQFAYIGGTGGITGCSVDQSTGNFTGCNLYPISQSIIGISNDMKLNSTNQYAYLATYNTNPYFARCNVSNGVVSSCAIAATLPAGAGTSYATALLQ